MALVIAEFCQNHNGDLGILERMVWEAADAGADYAKIQSIYSEDLTFREEFEKEYPRGGGSLTFERPYRPEFERLKRLEIPYEKYGWFIELCESAGIRPLTTVFTRAQADRIAGFSWDEVKVASYDCASIPLLETLSSRFRHLFISTGATYDEEIRATARALTGISFTFLHCVTIYPTPLEEMNLARMEFLREFTPSVGFSDHTLVARDGIKASAVALHLGADALERHYTILPPEKTRDGPISITTEQLRTLSRLAHGTPRERSDFIRDQVGDYSLMIGSRTRSLSGQEILNRNYYRGRFASTCRNGRVVYNWDDTEVEE